jgi:hypothetical protein
MSELTINAGHIEDYATEIERGDVLRHVEDVGYVLMPVEYDQSYVTSNDVRYDCALRLVPTHLVEDLSEDAEWVFCDDGSYRGAVKIYYSDEGIPQAIRVIDGDGGDLDVVYTWDVHLPVGCSILTAALVAHRACVLMCTIRHNDV